MAARHGERSTVRVRHLAATKRDGGALHARPQGTMPLGMEPACAVAWRGAA
jgi:hypothetical protein